MVFWSNRPLTMVPTSTIVARRRCPGQAESLPGPKRAGVPARLVARCPPCPAVMDDTPAQAAGQGRMADSSTSPTCPDRRGRAWGLPRALYAGAVVGVLAAVGLHAACVLLGPNFHTVLPGQVYRCAQPTPA